MAGKKVNTVEETKTVEQTENTEQNESTEQTENANTEQTASRRGSPLMSMKHDEFVNHAISVGKDAVMFLMNLKVELIPLTDEQKNKRRPLLLAKLKENKKTHERKPRYTPKQVEEILNRHVKRTLMEQRTAYCEKYWKEILPEKKEKAEKSEYDILLEKALALFDNE